MYIHNLHQKEGWLVNGQVPCSRISSLVMATSSTGKVCCSGVVRGVHAHA